MTTQPDPKPWHEELKRQNDMLWSFQGTGLIETEDEDKACAAVLGIYLSATAEGKEGANHEP